MSWEWEEEGKCLIFRETGHGANPSLPLTAVLFPYQQSKLEKADILEMTVKHLQNIQSSKMMGECPRPSPGALVPHPVPHPMPAGLILWQPGTSTFPAGRGPGCCRALAFSTRWGDGAGHCSIHGRCSFPPEPISAFWRSFASAAGHGEQGPTPCSPSPRKQNTCYSPAAPAVTAAALPPSPQLPFVSCPPQLTPRWVWKPSRGTAPATSSACTRCTTCCSPASGWTRPSGRAC